MRLASLEAHELYSVVRIFFAREVHVRERSEDDGCDA